MIAVVKIGGHQAIVSPGEKLEVDRIKAEVGETVELDVLLLSEEDGSRFEIGSPVLSKKIKAKILEHGKGRKIRVFKMNPRKRYRRTRGHRQDYTVIEIEEFATAPKKASKKSETGKVKKEEESKSSTDSTSEKKPKRTAAKKVAKKSQSE